MFAPDASMTVWLYGQATDMRKSFDGLSALVRTAMGNNPLDGALFVFVNRRRTMMKALYFAADGYCIWAKRLERGQFQVRFDGDAKVRMSLRTLRLLIDGIELQSVRQVRRYGTDFVRELQALTV
jgi:transposase